MDGGDATKWDEEGYRNTILKEREIQTRTVFRTVFAPTRNPNPDSIVVASSDGSISSYSISDCVSSLKQTSAFSNAGTQQVLEAEPSCFVRAHNGPAYDVKFYGDVDDSLLLSCGDDGRILGWRWQDVLNSKVPTSVPGNHLQPVLEFMNPQQKGPWGTFAPMPENNAIAVDSKGGSVFAAAGDSCAYCWDVESGKIKTVFKGHTDYLHCIIPRNSSYQIITGSEDGTARIWDCKSGKCIKVIEAEKDNGFKENSSCVSCIAIDASESWLAFGSGKSISVWNLSAFERISRIPTRASTQDIIFDANHILAVGAEHLLNRLDMDGVILSQIQCAPPSAFSVSLHPSGVMTVAGYGGLVDVISQFGSHLCTFRCRFM